MGILPVKQRVTELGGIFYFDKPVAKISFLSGLVNRCVTELKEEEKEAYEAFFACKNAGLGRIAPVDEDAKLQFVIKMVKMFRPDSIAYLAESFLMQLELDELQHLIGYERDTEAFRSLLFKKFATILNVPLYVLRLNPDGYGKSDNTWAPSCF